MNKYEGSVASRLQGSIRTCPEYIFIPDPQEHTVHSVNNYLSLESQNEGLIPVAHVIPDLSAFFRAKKQLVMKFWKALICFISSAFRVSLNLCTLSVNKEADIQIPI